jgi:hypothetical protein
MASTITITLDPQGKPTFSQLPPGVLHSQVNLPLGTTPVDAISINAGDVYTIAVASPEGLLGTVPAPLPPVTLQSSTPTQVTFSVNASPLPMSQTSGMAICPVGGSNFNLLVLANPATVPVALGIVGSSLQINQSSMPVGVYCDNAVPSDPKIYVGTGGGYAISFSLPSGDERFDSIQFEDPAVTLPNLISGDGLTAWIFNDHRTPHADIQSVGFTFTISSVPPTDPKPPRTFDPTIINNPINQGGGDEPKNMPDPRPDPRPALVAALAA